MEKDLKDESFINKYSQHENNIHGLCTQCRNNAIHGRIQCRCLHKSKYIRRSSSIYHEAQSYGIPAIATNVGGTGEIIDKDNGILLSPCPTLENVVSALEKVYKSDFNRDIIKNHWNKLSNAQINFKRFVDILSKHTIMNKTFYSAYTCKKTILEI